MSEDKKTDDTPTLETLAASLADMTKQFTAVKSKNEELLGEAKRAKTARREAEDKVEQDAKDKLLASSNYKELHKSSELEREKLLKQLDDMSQGVANEKVGNAATKLAAMLADGSNVELLASFVTKRLKFTDGKVQVLNADGELTVSTIEDLAKEFRADPKYSALLKGNKSSGGGANGGTNGSGATSKEIDRDAFNAMDHSKRSKFFADGGKVVD